MLNNVIEAIEPIFDTQTYILIGWKKEDVISFLKDKFNYEAKTDLVDVRGCSWDFRFKQVVWTEKAKDHSTLMHECGNVVFNILDTVEAFPSDSNQCEVMLRMQEFLFNAGLQK